MTAWHRWGKLDFFSSGGEAWVRIWRVQFGWHPRGRFRVLSERELGLVRR